MQIAIMDHRSVTVVASLMMFVVILWTMVSIMISGGMPLSMVAMIIVSVFISIMPVPVVPHVMPRPGILDRTPIFKIISVSYGVTIIVMTTFLLMNVAFLWFLMFAISMVVTCQGRASPEQYHHRQK